LRRKRLHLAFAGLCTITLASCGGGERQDANEPAGKFEVSVVSAEFPEEQKLAKRSELEIVVRNDELKRAVPNIAVTVKGFDERRASPGLADANRPVFVINGVPKQIGTFPESKQAAPEGGETAYLGTWALGPLEPGEKKTFRWNVTAVRPGPYKITYEVAAGLDGKARAVGTGGKTPHGRFAGTISDEPPDTRVGEDGKTVVEGVR
jgi:hypothetical protein